MENAAKSASPEAGDESQEEQQLPGAGMTVMICDDDASRRFWFSELARREGCEVIEAANGREALVTAMNQPLDVVVCDVRMPDISGFTVCKTLCANERTAGIPIIMVSAAEDPDETTVKALDSGAQDFISLPASQAEFTARLRRSLRDKKRYDKLVMQAIHDSLTGLFSRAYVDSTLPTALNRAERYREAFSIVLLDMDHLKVINDNFGHDMGDAAILMVADAIRAGLRSSDAAARMGGDEFLVLLPQTPPADAEGLGLLFRESIAECSLEADGVITELAACFGCAGVNARQSSPGAADLLKQADVRLYEMKQRRPELKQLTVKGAAK